LYYDDVSSVAGIWLCWYLADC